MSDNAGGAGGGGPGDPGGAGNQGGGAPPAFAETLPADIRGEAAFRDIKDIDGLARGFLGQSKLIGVPRERLLELPADPADAAGFGKIYDRLGRPEAPDKYSFAAPDPATGVKLDDAIVGSFREIAHKAGLSQAQVEALYGWNIGLATAQAKATQENATATHAAAEQALKTEFGAAYDEKLAGAKLALQHFGGAKGEEIAARYASDPDLVRIFAQVGAILKEDGLITLPAGKGGAAALSPAEAQQQIATKNADPAFLARRQSDDPAVRQAANAELGKLYAMGYPEDQAGVAR